MKSLLAVTLVPLLGGLSQVTGVFSRFTVELEFDPTEPEAATVSVVLAVDLHDPRDMDATTVGFTARTTLDRTVYGVSYQHQQIPDFIAHDVDVTIHTYARPR